jgi:hypothetical protein
MKKSLIVNPLTMTKTFTEKGIEYLLVEVPDNEVIQLGDVGKSIEGKHVVISLLKDITEEQAKEIMGWRDDWVSWKPRIEMLDNALQLEGIDTSLNWLLLKKI